MAKGRVRNETHGLEITLMCDDPLPGGRQAAPKDTGIHVRTIPLYRVYTVVDIRTLRVLNSH